MMMHEQADMAEGMPPALKIVPTIFPTSVPLEQNVESFWRVGPEFESIKIADDAAGASLSILKKLGPSPFSGGGFPLIGFLATTYDKVSRYATERLDIADGPNYE